MNYSELHLVAGITTKGTSDVDFCSTVIIRRKRHGAVLSTSSMTVSVSVILYVENHDLGLI